MKIEIAEESWSPRQRLANDQDLPLLNRNHAIPSAFRTGSFLAVNNSYCDRNSIRLTSSPSRGLPSFIMLMIAFSMDALSSLAVRHHYPGTKMPSEGASTPSLTFNRLLREFQVYYNTARPHRANGGRAPRPSLQAVNDNPLRAENVRTASWLGGLHHSYKRVA